MSDKNNSAAIGQDDNVFAPEHFLGELECLNRDHPDTGFGLSLKTHSGERYLLANAAMPLPKSKADGFPTGRQVVCLENGDRFSRIEILADSHAYETISPRDEAVLLADALELIVRIDTLPSIAAIRAANAPHVAATGTGG